PQYNAGRRQRTGATILTAVDYRREGDVAILTMTNPPVNALSFAVRHELAEALKRAVADEAVKGIVVSGGGGTFSGGADIGEIDSGLALKVPTIRDVQAQMERLPKPLVAAIEGTAFGGGLELALACHWRVAATTDRVGLPEVKLGLLPGAG